MTPPTWYAYAAKALDREQHRDQPPVYTRVETTAVGDPEQVYCYFWMESDDD